LSKVSVDINKKFEDLMLAGNKAQQMLDGLNVRFNKGIGQGKKYYAQIEHKK